MYIKFIEFLNEERNNNGVEVNHLSDIPVDQELRNYLMENGMNVDDVNLFCKYNDNKKVSVFELIVPWNLHLDLTDILRKGNLSLIELNIGLDFGFYWIDMGNGLTSISNGGISKYSAENDTFTIYSGEKRLNDFLEKDLELLFNAEKYNL